MDDQFDYPGGAANVLNNPEVQRGMAANGIYIAPGSVVECPDVRVSVGVRVNGPISIRGVGTCRLGKFAEFGHGVHILTSNHDLNTPNLSMTLNSQMGFKRMLAVKGPVVVGNNAWIGDNAVLLPGAEVGHGAVLGAGAVLSRAIPPFAVAVGAPARVVRLRFTPRIVEQLLDLAWWDWPMDRIRRNRVFFETDLTQDPDLDLARIVVD